MSTYKFGVENKKKEKSDIQLAIEEFYAFFDKPVRHDQVKCYERFLYENRITLSMFKSAVKHWVNFKDKWPHKSEIRKFLRASYAPYFSEIERLENKDHINPDNGCKYGMCIKGCKGWIYVKHKEIEGKPALVKRCKCINEKAYEEMLNHYVYVPEHETL